MNAIQKLAVAEVVTRGMNKDAASWMGKGYQGALKNLPKLLANVRQSAPKAGIQDVSLQLKGGKGWTDAQHVLSSLSDTARAAAGAESGSVSRVNLADAIRLLRGSTARIGKETSIPHGPFAMGNGSPLPNQLSYPRRFNFKGQQTEGLKPILDPAGNLVNPLGGGRLGTSRRLPLPRPTTPTSPYPPSGPGPGYPWGLGGV
jgi:hypothetical protein